MGFLKRLVQLISLPPGRRRRTPVTPWRGTRCGTPAYLSDEVWEQMIRESVVLDEPTSPAD
jgi:hypothetical protein